MRTKFISLVIGLACALPAVAQDKKSERKVSAEEAAVRESAEEAFNDRDWKAAAKSFRALVELNPKAGWAWHRLGYCLHADGKLDKALEIHHKAATFPKQRMIAYYNIACVHSLKGRVDKAFHWLAKSAKAGYHGFEHMAGDSDMDNLRDDPRYAELIAHMKLAAKTGKKDKKKKKGYKKEKGAKTEKGAWSNGEANERVGELAETAASAFEARDWKAAANHYSKVVEHAPDCGKSWMRLGYSLHALGKLDKALVAHKRAARSKDFRALGCYNAACVYAMTNKPDAAFEWLHEAIEAGFARAGHMEEDSDLDSIRDDPRFEKALALASAAKKNKKKKDKSWNKNEWSNGTESVKRLTELNDARAEVKAALERNAAEAKKLRAKLEKIHKLLEKASPRRV